MFEIRNRYTGNVIFIVSYRTLQGADLRGAKLQYANLQYENLQYANLQYENLQGASLQGADLRGADLRGANLRGANLQGADLQGANLQDANLRGADLRGAYLRGAYLRGANLIDCTLPPKAPIVYDIDKKILAAISSDNYSLNMLRWHTCETTHCRAGFAVHLAGEKGYELENMLGAEVAGTLIYLASRPGKKHPDFHVGNEEAMESIIEDASS